MIVTESWYLILSAALFSIGAVGLLVRRNPLVMFMCVELMLNAVNLSFVAFSTALDDLAGQTAVFFVLVVAAAEVVVGLSIVVALLRRQPSATVDDIAELLDVTPGSVKTHLHRGLGQLRELLGGNS